MFITRKGVEKQDDSDIPKENLDSFPWQQIYEEVDKG